MDLADDNFGRKPEPLVGQSSRWSLLANLLLFELAFYVAYRYGMAFPQDYPAPFWFPDSVLLCALLLTPRRTWWMYVAAPLPIRFLLFVPTGAPFWFLTACFVNDSLKALLAAWLLRRSSETANWFESVRGFLWYLLVAVLLAPALSAFGGAATLMAGRGLSFWSAWQHWFFGDALANLALTPGAFCLVRDFHKLGRATLARRIEACALAAGMILSTYWAFYLEKSSLRYSPFLWYLHVPFVLWGALRFGPLGACGTLSIVSALAVVGTLAGRGPFSLYTADSSIFEIQLFLCTLAIPFLFLAVLIRDRQNAQQTLNELTKKLGALEEADRHRIGLELHDDLGQRLVVLSWRLDGLAQQFKADAGLASEVGKLRAQATDISKDVVRLSHELRPATLARLGLSAALQSLCDQATAANGVAVRFAQNREPRQAPVSRSVRRSSAVNQADGLVCGRRPTAGLADGLACGRRPTAGLADGLVSGRRPTAGLADAVELSLYRVAQEALRNALKHSRSASVAVGLSESATSLDLSVSDDGCGFDAGSPHEATRLGLAGMAERMKNAGGTLRIVSVPGRGTTVTASVPLGARTTTAPT